MNLTPTLETLPEELFTLSQLHRKLDICCPKALQLVKDKVIPPDFTSRNAHLFRASRLPEIKAAVAAAQSR